MTASRGHRSPASLQHASGPASQLRTARGSACVRPRKSAPSGTRVGMLTVRGPLTMPWPVPAIVTDGPHTIPWPAPAIVTDGPHTVLQTSNGQDLHQYQTRVSSCWLSSVARRCVDKVIGLMLRVASSEEPRRVAPIIYGPIAVRCVNADVHSRDRTCTRWWAPTRTQSLVCG